MSAKRTESLWTRRKMLVRVALGSAAGVALAACGGGEPDRTALEPDRRGAKRT